MEFCRIHLDEVDSTNNYAANWLNMTKSIHPAVITARHQRYGRGQRQNHWLSEKNKNLTCSFIVFPHHIKLEKLGFLNKAVANALHRTLTNFISSKMDIKWPNDIWVNGKKIAGILIENNWRSQSLQHSIIGIGININQIFPSDDPWCSMYSITNEHFEIEFILDQLQLQIKDQFGLLEQFNFQLIDEYYHQHLLKKNELVSFTMNGRQFSGTIQGVDEWGRIILQSKDGKNAFLHGEVVIQYP